ncbi:MAG TPA: type II toxin-antitoxin system RelE/ParE family toxin [Desulfohalobiaceae bacterium]|nr:type II toxin-antitoxin system RelE/ParE family toxin [Desulfohalobiaceae bacterium]
MKIYRTKPFTRLARKADLKDEFICQAVNEMNQGLIDVSLGSGLFKKRIAMPGRGKSGSWRTLLGFQSGRRAFFLYVFPKSNQENIQAYELKGLKRLAKFYISLQPTDIQTALEKNELYEVKCDENQR